MRAILLLAALAAAPAISGTLVARQGADSVRLDEAPCTSKPVLGRIEPAQQAKYRAATATVQGQMFEACWRMTPNGAHLLYEDGDQGLVPASDLKPEMTA